MAARMFESLKLGSKQSNEDLWKEELAENLRKSANYFLERRVILFELSAKAIPAGPPRRVVSGGLYEALYDQMLDVPVPPNISSDLRDTYIAELQKRVGVLVKSDYGIRTLTEHGEPGWGVK